MTFSVTGGIRGSLARARSIQGRYWGILAAILIGASLLGWYSYSVHRETSDFADLYAQYAALAAVQDNAAYVPGAEQNPVRQQLNGLLQEMLATDTKTNRRLDLARGGLKLLDQSKDQLDQLSVAKDAADAMVAKMQVSILSSLAPNDSSKEIVVLAKKRSDTVSDIRAYSFKADFEMQQIFDRIISDEGKLVPEFVIELNQQVPQVETEFDKRTQLYSELQSEAQKIEDAFKAQSGS